MNVVIIISALLIGYLVLGIKYGFSDESAFEEETRKEMENTK